MCPLTRRELLGTISIALRHHPMASHSLNLFLGTGSELVMQIRFAPEWYFGDALQFGE
jgi:hypothetical protein